MIKTSFGVPAAALREITALKNLARHPNIISLHEAVVEDDRVFLVCDYADKDLRAHMNSMGKLLPQRIKLYAWQVFNGTAHCHSHRLPHRDIKPQNLLVHVATDCLKLCDFSLSRPVLSPRHQQTQRVASLWYRSPEILLGGPAKGMLLDAWSTGCVFGELLKHTPMFPGASEIETLMFQFRTLGTPDESIWSGLSQLPHWKDTFPRFPQPQPGRIEGLLPDRLGSLSGCDPMALTLLLSLLRLQPEARLAPARCLHHSYFFDLDTQVGMPCHLGRARGCSDQSRKAAASNCAKKRRRDGDG